MSRDVSGDESAANRVTRLLVRARTGNTVARDELVESVYLRMNRLCQALKRKFPGVTIYEQTGDIMGQVWPKLLRELSAKDFRDSAHFFSYSATLIRHVLIDILRKYYGRNGHASNEISLAPGDHQDTAEKKRTMLWEGRDTNSPDRDLMRAEVHTIINRLSSQDQEMFNLRFYHDLKESECAEAMGVDVRTVRRRWRRARLALASELKQLEAGHLPKKVGS